MFPSRLARKFANGFLFGISFVGFVGYLSRLNSMYYKTSFAFVLATDAVSSSKHTVLRNFHSRPTPMYRFVAYNDVDAVKVEQKI